MKLKASGNKAREQRKNNNNHLKRKPTCFQLNFAFKCIFYEKNLRGKINKTVENYGT